MQLSAAMVFSRHSFELRGFPEHPLNQTNERRGTHVPSSDFGECIGCGICIDACPQGTIEVVDGVCTVVNEESCIACGDCVEECPMGAIEEIIED